MKARVGIEIDVVDSYLSLRPRQVALMSEIATAYPNAVGVPTIHVI